MLASIFVWTLESVVIVTLLCIALMLIVIGLIKHAFDVIFKKHCRKCKHCYLHSVPSVGDGSTYKCDIKEKNRTIRTGIDCEYVFCKDYREK